MRKSFLAVHLSTWQDLAVRYAESLEIVEKVFHWFEETTQSRAPRLWKAANRNLALLLKGFTYNSACKALRLHARRCATQRGLPTKICAPHKGKFFLDMIQQPIALFQTLHGNVFHLGNCVEVRLQVNAPPALPYAGSGYSQSRGVALANSHSQRL